MAISSYRFLEIDSDQSFNSLAEALGAKCVNGVIRMPSTSGTGSIRKIKFEEGFHLRAWELTPTNQLQFQKDPALFNGEKLFHIAYLLNPRQFHTDKLHLGPEFPVPEGMNVLFLSSDASMSFDVAPAFEFKMIDISFTSAWMTEAFREADSHIQSFIAQLEENIQPAVVLDACTFTEYKILTALHEKSLHGQNGMLQIKANTLSLLSDFFNRLFRQQPQEVLGSKIFHYHRMLQVEKILQDHLQKKLPPLDAIAHDVALSVSTLKRHFKLMYGRSIYEYYLDLKMELARRLLQEKPLTINEVAAMLDYEKVSSFIDMFKKHFGYSPGHIRKNGILR